MSDKAPSPLSQDPPFNQAAQRQYVENLKPAHTPGPFLNDRGAIRTVAKDNAFPAGRKLATVHLGPVSQSEFIANCNLFAAADDLVKACQRARDVINYWDDISDTDRRQTFEQLEAAIAKAEGRQS